jgi:hypothetical protein
MLMLVGYLDSTIAWFGYIAGGLFITLGIINALGAEKKLQTAGASMQRAGTGMMVQGFKITFGFLVLAILVWAVIAVI